MSMSMCLATGDADRPVASSRQCRLALGDTTAPV